MRSDESTATNEKFLLEEEQRRASRERKAKLEEWLPRLFDRNIITGDWVYKYSE
jgi:oxysterol-binding protein-related protein 8